MTGRTLFILLWPFLASKAFAQHEQTYLRQIDSLKKRSLQLKHDTNLVRCLNRLASFQCLMKQSGSAATADRAYGLAVHLRDTAGIVEALLNKGVIAEMHSDHRGASKFYLQADTIVEKKGDYGMIMDVHSRLLNTLFYTGHYPLAMKITLRGLKLAEARNDKRMIASRHNLLGFIYHNQGDLRHAYSYYNHYLHLSRSLGDSNMVANACNNLADVFLGQKRYDRAFSFHFHALEIYTAAQYWERMANTCFGISKVCFEKKDHVRALHYINTTFRYVTEKVKPNLYDLAGYYIHLGKIQLCLHEAGKALVSLRQALALSRSIRHSEDIKEACYNLSEAWRVKKQYDSAYHYYTLYARIKDSLMNEKTRQQVEELNMAYGVEKNEARIRFLNQKVELGQSNARRELLVRNAAIAFLVLLGLVFFLLYNRYRLKQRNRLQQEFVNQQAELFNSLMAVQDNERKRIAEDLHDGLGSMLSLAKLNLERVRDEKLDLNEAQQQEYNRVLAMLDEMIQELRHVSHNLMPATLSRLGLIAALRNLFDSISAFSGIRINFITHGINSRLHDTIEINLYRIILELTNNAVKHAQAGEITVQLIRYDAYVAITCEDNGKGFEYHDVQSKGLGLGSVVSRVGFLNGTIDIDSWVGKGTTVMIEIPFTNSNTNILVENAAGK